MPVELDPVEVKTVRQITTLIEGLLKEQRPEEERRREGWRTVLEPLRRASELLRSAGTRVTAVIIV